MVEMLMGREALIGAGGSTAGTTPAVTELISP
jgi:hypothetical protein